MMLTHFSSRHSLFIVQTVYIRVFNFIVNVTRCHKQPYKGFRQIHVYAFRHSIKPGELVGQALYTVNFGSAAKDMEAAPMAERLRALFIIHSIISPLCLVWVRARSGHM